MILRHDRYRVGSNTQSDGPNSFVGDVHLGRALEDEHERHAQAWVSGALGLS